MERFEPPYPMLGSAPKNFTLSIGGSGVTKIACSFSDVTREYQIDAVITALLAVRSLLKQNRLPPIPRNRSLTKCEAHNG